MARTIILTQYEPEPGHSEYWSVTEDGRICDGLSWDEMLGAVARLTLNKDVPYRMETIEQMRDRGRRERDRRDPISPPPVVDDDMPF